MAQRGIPTRHGVKTGREIANGLSKSVPPWPRERLEARFASWHIPDELAEEFFDHHTVVTYQRGATIFKRGTLADFSFWLFSGLVKIFCPTPVGEPVLAGLAGSGDFLGETHFLDCKKRRAQAFEAEALTKCSVAIVTREHVTKLLHRLPQGALVELLEGMSLHWSSAAYRHASFLGLSFRDRLKVVLTELGSKFGAEHPRGIVLLPELRHEDLAQMIGSSRPMVSKVVAEFTESGVLTYEGSRLILADPGRWKFLVGTD